MLLGVGRYHIKYTIRNNKWDQSIFSVKLDAHFISDRGQFSSFIPEWFQTKCCRLNRRQNYKISS